MADRRAEWLRPDRFPRLAEFVPGYLHQDLDICDGVEGALASWHDDTSDEAAQALADEWSDFLALTDGLPTDERARLLEAGFGGAWAPRSDEELHTLTRALGAYRRG